MASEAESSSQMLPGLEMFSREQLFWLAYGSSMCAKVTPENMAYQVSTGSQAPNNIRIRVSRILPALFSTLLIHDHRAQLQTTQASVMPSTALPTHRFTRFGEENERHKAIRVRQGKERSYYTSDTTPKSWRYASVG